MNEKLKDLTLNRSTFLEIKKKTGLTNKNLSEKWGMSLQEVSKATSGEFIHPLIADAILGLVNQETVNEAKEAIDRLSNLLSSNTQSEKQMMIDLAHHIAGSSRAHKGFVIVVLACILKKKNIGFTLAIIEANKQNVKSIKTRYKNTNCIGTIVHKVYLRSS